jgi:hypothetical protein
MLCCVKNGTRFTGTLVGTGFASRPNSFSEKLIDWSESKLEGTMGGVIHKSLGADMRNKPYFHHVDILHMVTPSWSTGSIVS